MKYFINQKGGVVLLATIIMLGVIALMAAGMSLMVSQDIHMTRRLGNVTKAYYIAEAGIEEAIAYHADPDNDGFSGARFSKDGEFFGEGLLSVSVNETDTPNLYQIVSVGNVGNTSRTIKVLVKDTTPPAISLEYAAVSGGKMQYWLRTNIDHHIHSNSTAYPTQFWHNWWPICVNYNSIYIGAFTNIDGIASACGEIYNLGNEVIEEYADQVELPPFGADFFNYYYTIAAGQGHVYNGNQSLPSLSNGVYYINGDVTLTGTWTFTGCIVATGNIQVNPGRDNRNGSITFLQMGSLPALMSINGDIGIYESTTVNGLVYAGGKVVVFDFLQDGPIDINGICISKGDMIISGFFATSSINYVAQNPPGLTPPSMEILCWSD